MLKDFILETKEEDYLKSLNVIDIPFGYPRKKLESFFKLLVDKYGYSFFDSFFGGSQDKYGDYIFDYIYKRNNIISIQLRKDKLIKYATTEFFKREGFKSVNLKDVVEKITKLPKDYIQIKWPVNENINSDKIKNYLNSIGIVNIPKDYPKEKIRDFFNILIKYGHIFAGDGSGSYIIYFMEIIRKGVCINKINKDIDFSECDYYENIEHGYTEYKKVNINEVIEKIKNLSKKKSKNYLQIDWKLNESPVVQIDWGMG